MKFWLSSNSRRVCCLSGTQAKKERIKYHWNVVVISFLGLGVILLLHEMVCLIFNINLTLMSWLHIPTYQLDPNACPPPRPIMHPPCQPGCVRFFWWTMHDIPCRRYTTTHSHQNHLDTGPCVWYCFHREWGTHPPKINKWPSATPCNRSEIPLPMNRFNSTEQTKSGLLSVIRTKRS